MQTTLAIHDVVTDGHETFIVRSTGTDTILLSAVTSITQDLKGLPLVRRAVYTLTLDEVATGARQAFFFKNSSKEAIRFKADQLLSRGERFAEGFAPLVRSI